MNKYYVKIPYNYVKYGTLSAYVYAEDSEEAQDLAYECENRHSEDYDDSDDSGDTEYSYSDMEVELEEEDVNSPDTNSNNSNLPFSNIPSYFLAELQQL
jgi:hypothetical protein